MSKAELRKKYKNLRKELSREAIDTLSLEIANQALSIDIWDRQYYHIFLPIKRLREIDTTYLLSILSGKDKHILLSTTQFKEGTMKHYLLTDSTPISINAYGIPEPEGGIEISADKIDVVFIPLLGYDLKGNRLGYGKGFYDRFLSSCRPDIIKVGLSLFEPEQKPIEIQATDIPLTYCITPKKVYKF